MDQSTVCAILLAAGEGKRMGTQKLLLPFGDTTVAGASLRALLGSRVAQVVVVLGHQAEEVRQSLSQQAEAAAQSLPVKFVLNDRYQEGMFSSVLCGLAAAATDADAFLISLADQPAITSQVIDALLAAFFKQGPEIALPTYHGRRGHPLLFHRRYLDEVRRLDPQAGLRGLLSLHPDKLLEVPVDTSAVVRDIDYWDDYLSQRP